MPIQSQGIMSQINAHHAGKAIKAEEMGQQDNQFSIIFITPPERTNKELINLVYNDVKNLASILNFSRAPKCVSF